MREYPEIPLSVLSYDDDDADGERTADEPQLDNPACLRIETDAGETTAAKAAVVRLCLANPLPRRAPSLAISRLRDMWLVVFRVIDNDDVRLAATVPDVGETSMVVGTTGGPGAEQQLRPTRMAVDLLRRVLGIIHSTYGVDEDTGELDPDTAGDVSGADVIEALSELETQITDVLVMFGEPI